VGAEGADDRVSCRSWNEGDAECPGSNTIDVPELSTVGRSWRTSLGGKNFPEDLAQAIRTAREGFPVPEITASYWSQAADKLRENEEAARFI